MIVKYSILAEFIASLAGLLSIIAYIPQTYKVYLTNQTDDLDINTFGLLLIIKFLWIIWGFLIGSISIILFGVIQICIVSYIVLKINKNFDNNTYYHKHYYDNYMRLDNKH
jgi:MtN3 and saliva related transmembrane protein